MQLLPNLYSVKGDKPRCDVGGRTLARVASVEDAGEQHKGGY
jgi:hypothetical protein